MMNFIGTIRPSQSHPITPTVEIASRSDIEDLDRWQKSFANCRKDHRYFELVEDTIHQGFEYGYFVIRDECGDVTAIQPYFINDQDLLAGTSQKIRSMADAIRRVWPRFLRMRTLMVGCAAGEGYLDGHDEIARVRAASALSMAIEECGRALKCRLIVFKEFTAPDRAALSCLLSRGFVRIPSMPMTSLRLNWASFEDYLSNMLSRNTRSQLRRKYKASAQKAALQMRVVTDATPYIEDLYPLYVAVYQRSSLQFEKLTPQYFCEIGRRVPDKALFFLWFEGEKLVAFNLCTLHDNAICSDYIGFDYSVAFETHLYYVVFRDIATWAIANDIEWYRSTSLNYEPKYRLRQSLEPLDLYIKHTRPAVNFILQHALHFLEPTRYDKLLHRFDNYRDMYC